MEKIGLNETPELYVSRRAQEAKVEVATAESHAQDLLQMDGERIAQELRRTNPEMFLKKPEG